jgi:type VII secretion protein EccB
VATKRDLVEAHAFSRRRLVTAFVSGAPGGREVEPARPGRTIVGGVALAVLLIAGAAIAGVFAPRDPQDWNKPGLVVSKETGAAYVILEESDHPVLRPVINITSARLILQDDIEPTLVSQDTIDQQTIGDDIGILGAPPSLPTSSLLIDSGWTACTADRSGIHVDVSASPDVVPVHDSGFLVESNGAFYVIAEARPASDEAVSAYRYQLPHVSSGSLNGDQDNLLGDLGLPIRKAATHVPEKWLALFPPGGDLDFQSFGLDGFGEQVAYAGDGGVPGDARVGDVLTVDGGESLLLTAKGPAVLDGFALTLYRHTMTPRGFLAQGSRSGDSPVETIVDAAPPVDQDLPPYLGAHWPDHLLDTVLSEHCAELTTAPGEAPRVRIATDPGEGAAAGDLAAGKVLPTVDPGRGAYVLSGDWPDSSGGSPYVIDAKGLGYPLVGDDAAARLGYGDHAAVVVPDSWIELFDPGVNLSVDEALCRPRSKSTEPCT